MAVKNILISQNTPRVLNQYQVLTEKFGVTFDFRPFFRSEVISLREFRAQKVNIPDFTAVVFSSRHAIDAYFKICEEIRFKVPETMKYFCTSEIVAMYLQKHIVYRKRKIFFGNGSSASIVDLIGTKHKGEKFLITASDSADTGHLTSLFDAKGLDYTKAVFVKSVTNDLKSEIDLGSYDMMVLYNPSDLKSLQENFPDFAQGDMKIATYGKAIARSAEEAGLRVDLKAPTDEAPSVAKAIELYLQNLS